MVSAFADIVKLSDWRRYESRIERSTYMILDLLEENRIKATFFVLGWIAEHYPSIVREIYLRGHELASHGYCHRLVYELTPGEFREDVRKAKSLIEDITGTGITGFRAASYSITEKSFWALDILMEEGFLYDSSIFPIRHDRYGYPSFDRFSAVVQGKDGRAILEIPLSTVRILGRNVPVAGGGYLRFFPVRFISWGLRSINQKESQPAVIYFHPWEIDPGQPKIQGKMISRLRHNLNLDKTIFKLRTLIKDFSFGPIKEAFSGRLEEISTLTSW